MKFPINIKNYPATIDKQAIEKYLDRAKDEVLDSLTVPFGTFPKARYELYNSKFPNIPKYDFTTTIHSEGEAIQKLIEIFNKKRWDTDSNFYLIFKIQAGKKELIYTNKPGNESRNKNYYVRKNSNTMD